MEPEPQNLERKKGNGEEEEEEEESLPLNSFSCQLERRLVLFLFAFGCTSLVAGVVYGWPALRRQLQEDGTTLTEAQLGGVYTVGSWSAQGGRFFTGLARDRWGTRSVACFSLLCTFAGAVGIALSDASNGVALGSSLFCISLGAGTQLVMQPVGSLFPQVSNAIISSLSGSFQISGLVFLGLTSLPMSRRAAFLGYAALVALLIVLSWFLLPATPSFLLPADESIISKNKNEATTEHLADLPSASDRDNPEEEEPKNDDDTKRLTKLQQIMSAEYIGLLVWFSTCLIPMQYYVGSIGFQLEEKGDDDGFYSNLFSIVFAAAAVLAPIGGYLSDRLGLGLTQGFSTLLVALAFFILGSNSISLEGQAAGLVCYSVGRMLIFGMFFSNVGKRFGYENFGTLSGVGLLLSAILSLCQYPMIAAASEDSSTASIVNFSSGAVLLALIPYCMWLAVAERRVDSARSFLR